MFAHAVVRFFGLAVLVLFLSVSVVSASVPGKLSESNPPRTEAAPPAYVHRWNMDLFLVGAALAVGLWMATVLWVQRDAQGTAAQVKRANADVLLLPGIGLVLYLIARAKRQRQREQLRSHAPQPAEPKKKRRLFDVSIISALQPKKRRGGLEFLDADHNPIQIKKDMPEMTGIEAAQDVLEDAIAERASDVHIEPREKSWQVRFRIDGVLQERMRFEKTDGQRVVAALKTVAQIDVAEKRKAQDGRFRARTGASDVDFRVATATSIHGEKMVLRILDSKSGLLSLSELGMPKQMMEQFDRVIHSRSGIILATGPTGSGKTSTLYAALSRLDSKQLNIMTIEDPVEYELDGATQIPVNPKAGVTYESGLRSIMRQDPDVIFVGEMRDAEAAKIAMRAALTGHLVLSSLHTKDAISTVVRLEEIGIEKYQLSSALLMLVAQRLVRVLCKRCRELYQPAPADLAELGMSLGEGEQVYRARGCEACDNTGYQGRTGIFELLVLDDELRRAIDQGATEQAMLEMAARKGFRSYREDGMQKIRSGITTVEEVREAS